MQQPWPTMEQIAAAVGVTIDEAAEPRCDGRCLGPSTANLPNSQGFSGPGTAGWSTVQVME